MNVNVRLGQPKDKPFLIKWLNDPGIIKWFPMEEEREIEYAASIWITYTDKKSFFIVECDGVPCGSLLLYVQEEEKFKHHALFAIIVSEDYRNKGIGTILLKDVIRRAKEDFNLEIIFLETFHENPAVRFYERLGFKKFGVHKKFIKESDGTYHDKIFMRKYL